MDQRRPSAWRGSGNRDLGLIGVYEKAATAYGWTADFIETQLTDELFYRYIEKLADREIEQARVEEDRLTVAVATAMAIRSDEGAMRRWLMERRQRFPQTAPSADQQAATFARLGISDTGGRIKIH